MAETFHNTLEEFASGREIIVQLSKMAVKHDSKVREAHCGERREPVMDPELAGMMPAHFCFRQASRKARVMALANFLQHRIAQGAPEEYISRLSEFVSKVQGIVRTGDFEFPSPRLIPQFKDGDDSAKKYVYRPLSAYTDLTAKVVMGLVAAYLSECFDPYFHDEMLAYRLPREYHGQKNKVTTNRDAVPTILEYAGKHKDDEIWVAECDIQKFFDILKHSVILECFDDLVERVREDHPEFDTTISRALLESFLDSYSFYNDVYAFNKAGGEDSEFWKKCLGRSYDPEASYSFGWIKEEVAERNSDCDDFSDLGIPQGAALSTIVTNIVLQSVDSRVIGEPDENRLYVRYCDDIVIMHTDRRECERLTKLYTQALRSHCLEFHRFKDVSQLPKKRTREDESDTGRWTNEYWGAKSKEPFKWGRYNGNSAEWIGFLGFEIRWDGSVRMRRSSVGKKSDKIYRDIIQIRDCKDEGLRQRHLKRLLSAEIGIPSETGRERNLLFSHTGINDNSYTERQIRGLEKFREKYLRKMGIIH